MKNAIRSKTTRFLAGLVLMLLVFNEHAQSQGIAPESAYCMLYKNGPNTKTLVDGCLAAYSENFNNAVDYDDVTKLPNGSENAGLKRGNYLLAIERRKTFTSNDTLFLNITGTTPHLYQWDIILKNMNAVGRSAVLIDRYLNTVTELATDDTTSLVFNIVNLPASFAADRFILVFQYNASLLPVTFTNVRAQMSGKGAVVSWRAEAEADILSYKIQYSQNGNTFNDGESHLPIANNGAAANYVFPADYSGTQQNFYRVKAESKNGHVQYSTIVKLAATEAPQLAVYPNPAEGNTVHLKVNIPAAGTYSIKLTDRAGHVVRTESINAAAGSFEKEIQLTGLPRPSMYFVTLTGENGRSTTVKLKLL